MPARLAWLGLLFALTLFAAALPAHATDPIKIGFGMSLTGKLASNGKMALVGMQIWEDDINSAGGLIGRPWRSHCAIGIASNFRGTLSSA